MPVLTFHDGSKTVSEEAMRTLALFSEFFNVSGVQIAASKADQPIELTGFVRDDLPAFFAFAGLKSGAEIGVEQGAFSETLIRKNPGCELFSVDAWLAYKGYREHVSQGKLDGFYEATKVRLERAAAETGSESEVIKGLSTTVSTTFRDGGLDFVYLDGNHTLPQVIADLAAWTPKVRVGGVIAGHDYIRGKQSGYQVHVVDGLHAWTRSYNVKPWFVLGGKEKVEGVPRDRARSWVYVRLE